MTSIFSITLFFSYRRKLSQISIFNTNNLGRKIRVYKIYYPMLIINCKSKSLMYKNRSDTHHEHS